MATAKRKQEELGEECDEPEHEPEPCSDDDDAKRPRLDPYRQWSHQTRGERATDLLLADAAEPRDSDPFRVPSSASDSYQNYYNYREDAPFDLSPWQRRHADEHRNRVADSELNVHDDGDDQPINFAYYHF